MEQNHQTIWPKVQHYRWQEVKHHPFFSWKKNSLSKIFFDWKYMQLEDLSTEHLLDLYNNKLIIKNPELKVIYQDTDSNYCEMKTVYQGKIKSQFQHLKRYVQTTTSGLYNNFFCESILKSMDKYPLKFNFEGAFEKSFYITKKNYLGQKIPAITCKFEGDKLIPLDGNGKHCKPEDGIKEKIDLGDYDGGDMAKYLDSKHIKVVGLKLIKRNTILLSKKLYLQMIELVLNEGYNCSKDNQFDYVLKIIKDAQQNFYKYDVENLLEKKKITKKWINANQFLTQKYQLGLGDTIYTYYTKPEFINENRLLPSKFKKTDYLVVYKINGKIIEKKEPHKGQYIHNILCNLMKFIDNDITEKQIKQFSIENDLVLYGQQPKLKLQDKDLQYIHNLFDLLVQINKYNDDNLIEYDDSQVCLTDVICYLLKVFVDNIESRQQIRPIFRKYLSL